MNSNGTLPGRTIHVQTVHQQGEENSLVVVSRGFPDEQLETAKQLHKNHYGLGISGYVEIITHPIDEWEFYALRNKIVTLYE